MASLTELKALREQLRGQISQGEAKKADQLKQLYTERESLAGSISSLQTDIDQGTGITPTNLSAGAAGRKAGFMGLESSYLTARSAFNFAVGDDEEGAELFDRAQSIDERAGRVTQHLVKFEDFVGDLASAYKGDGSKSTLDLLGDFSELTNYTVNQALPSALDSLAWAAGGFVAGGFTTGGVASAPLAVTGLVAKNQLKRVVRDAIVEHGKGRGTKLQAEVAQDALKRMAKSKAMARAKGASMGAHASGYIQGVSSSFQESMESGVGEQDAAQLAFAMGVPFAVMDVLPEARFIKSVKKLAGADHYKKGAYLRNLTGGVVKAGAKQGISELIAETGQEGLMVAQRFAQDPNYDFKSATMRLSEAAFAGLMSGRALGMGGKAVGNVAQQAKHTVQETRDILAERRSQQPPDGQTPQGTDLPQLPSAPSTPALDNNPMPSDLSGGVSFDSGSTTSAGMAFDASDLSQENMAEAPIVDLLAMVQEVESDGLLAADPATQESAAAAIQELNLRADKMGQNRFQELVREELNKHQTANTIPLTRDEELQAEQTIAMNEAEAGANDLREAGLEETLVGKGKNNEGYKPGRKSIHNRVAKLKEENPGKQYEVVTKDGLEFIEETSMLDDREDVSELVNEGVKKARAGTKQGGVDRTVQVAAPDGKRTRISPTEMAHAGMRINNKEKSVDFEADYPQLLLTGFQRMAQEMANLGYVFDENIMPDSTVVSRKGRNAYTWGNLKASWVQKSKSNKSGMADVAGMNERDLIKAESNLSELETRIDKQQQKVADLEIEAQQAGPNQSEASTQKLDYAKQRLSDLYELLDPAVDSVNRIKTSVEEKLETTSTTQEMSENNTRQADNKQRQVDENGNPIIYSDRRPKNKPKPKSNPKKTINDSKRQRAEAQAAKDAEANSTGAEQQQRTSKNGTTAWGSVPDLFQNYIDAIKKTLNIGGDIHIVFRDEIDGTSIPTEVRASADTVLNKGAKAAAVSHGGAKYIVLNRTADNDYRQAEQIFILGHEMGHIVMWDMWDALPKAQQERLWKQFSKERLSKKAGSYTYTNDKKGFEEWFADQTSAWAKKQTEKPGHFTEAFFKKVAGQLATIWNRSRQFVRRELESGVSPKARGALRDMKERATLNETFDEFMDEVVGRNQGEVNFVMLDDTDATFGNSEPKPRKKVQATKRRSTSSNKDTNIVVPNFGDFERDPIALAIADLIDSKAVQRLTELMGEMWSSDIVSGMLKVTLSADQYARTRLGKHGPAFANLFYHRTQSRTRGEGDMLNKQHHALDKWNAQFAEVLGGDPKHAHKVLEEMQAGVTIDQSIDPKMRQQLANFFDRFHSEYLKKRIPKIGKIQNYFPVVYNIQAIHADPDAFLAELKKAGLNKRESQTIMRAMLENDGAFIEDIPNHEVFGPQFNAKMQRVLKNMDAKSLQDQDFYQDPLVAVQLYLKQATKHAEYNVVKDQAERLIQQMSPKQKAQAQKIVMGYLGRLGAHIDPKWNKYQSYMAALQFSTTLLYSVIASFTDIGNPIIRSKDMHGFKSAMGTWREYMSKQTRDEQILFAERVGAASREAVQEALHQAYNSEFIDPGARKWSDRYFRAIGLEQWTRMTRVISANMGRDFISHHAKKAAEGDKRSLRYLEELGLTPETVFKGYDVETDTLDLTTPEGEAVQEAILNFVDEAIIRPNAAHRPTWASDPRFMLIWQLKSFFYSFGQIVVGGVLRESKSRWKEGDKIGAMMSVGLMFGVLMPLAALALQTRELIKGALGKNGGGDDEGILGYLFELIDRTGILGPMSIIKMMSDAGDYGRSGVVTALGPTAGTLETFFTGDMGDLAKRLTPIYSQL